MVLYRITITGVYEDAAAASLDYGILSAGVFVA